LRLELPCPELLRATLHYLYTGELPAEMTRTMPEPDLDVLFGLLANAKFLLCDELVRDCVAILKTRIKSRRQDGHYKPITAHPSFCSDLVPVSFIADLLVDKSVSPRVRLEMVLSWVERTEGPFPEADQEHLRPLLETSTKGSAPVDDTVLGDLCQRFPTGAAVFGPGLLADMGKRLTSRAREVKKLRRSGGLGGKRMRRGRTSSAAASWDKEPWEEEEEEDDDDMEREEDQLWDDLFYEEEDV
jgi:hypothetical protein